MGTEITHKFIGDVQGIAHGDHPEIMDRTYYIFGRDWKAAEDKQARHWFVFRAAEDIKAIPFRTAKAQTELAAGYDLEQAFIADLSERTRRMILDTLKKIDFPDGT